MVTGLTSGRKHGGSTRLAGLLTAVLIFGTGLYPGLVSAESSLQTTAVTVKNLPETHWFDGTVEAVNRATVSAQISARVTEIAFDVDDYVEAGEVLVRFDPAELDAALSQAEGALKEARAVRDGAQREFTRLERLFNNKTIARAQYDAAKSAYNAARARESAASAALARATEQASRNEVTAPFSGFVTRRHVELGELASPGQPLMSGISLDSLRVTLALPERIVSRLQDDSIAMIILPDGNVLTSQDLTIFPLANPQTHSVNVRVALPEDTETLYPGMLVRVGFDIARKERLTVPADAVIYRGEITGVYRITEDGQVRLQQVRTGRVVSDSIEIVSGLQADDTIAVDPRAAMRQVQARIERQP